METTICWACDSEARLVREPREVPTATRRVVIEDEFYRCSACGETFYHGGMAEVSMRRAADKVREEEGLLTPGEIVDLRSQYGLSQAELERLIGAGPKTVVRWERGTVNQNATADTLLRVLRDHPQVTAELARERGVTLHSAGGGEAPARRRGRLGERAIMAKDAAAEYASV